MESTRAMTRERGSPSESKNCEILLLPTADRRFDTEVKCPTGRASFWVKLPTVRSLTRVKCPGGNGRFWNWLVHYMELTNSFIPECTVWLLQSSQVLTMPFQIVGARASGKFLGLFAFDQLCRLYIAELIPIWWNSGKIKLFLQQD